MAITRGFKPAEQTLLDTSMKLPAEYLAMGAKGTQNVIDQVRKGIVEIGDKNLTPLAKDQERASLIKKGLRDNIDGLYEKYDGDLSKMRGELVRLRRNVKDIFDTPGGIGHDINASYKAHQDYKTLLDKRVAAGHFSQKVANTALQKSMEGYQGISEESRNLFSGVSPYKDVVLTDKAGKLASQVKAESTKWLSSGGYKKAGVSPEGKQQYYRPGTSSVILKEDAIKEIIREGMMGDPEVKAYLESREQLGIDVNSELEGAINFAGKAYKRKDIHDITDFKLYDVSNGGTDPNKPSPRGEYRKTGDTQGKDVLQGVFGNTLSDPKETKKLHNTIPNNKKNTAASNMYDAVMNNLVNDGRYKKAFNALTDINEQYGTDFKVPSDLAAFAKAPVTNLPGPFTQPQNTGVSSGEQWQWSPYRIIQNAGQTPAPIIPFVQKAGEAEASEKKAQEATKVMRELYGTPEYNEIVKVAENFDNDFHGAFASMKESSSVGSYKLNESVPNEKQRKANIASNEGMLNLIKEVPLESISISIGSIDNNHKYSKDTAEDFKNIRQYITKDTYLGAEAHPDGSVLYPVIIPNDEKLRKAGGYSKKAAGTKVWIKLEEEASKKEAAKQYTNTSISRSIIKGSNYPINIPGKGVSFNFMGGAMNIPNATFDYAEQLFYVNIYDEETDQVSRKVLTNKLMRDILTEQKEEFDYQLASKAIMGNFQKQSSYFFKDERPTTEEFLNLPFIPTNE